MIDTKTLWLFVWIVGTLFTTARANRMSNEGKEGMDLLCFIVVALVVFSWTWPLTIFMNKDAWQAEV